MSRRFLHFRPQRFQFFPIAQRRAEQLRKLRQSLRANSYKRTLREKIGACFHIYDLPLLPDVSKKGPAQAGFEEFPSELKITT